MSKTKKIITGVIGGVIVVALVCVLAFVLPKNSNDEVVISASTTDTHVVEVEDTTKKTKVQLKTTASDVTLTISKEELATSIIKTTTTKTDGGSENTSKSEVRYEVVSGSNVGISRDAIDKFYEDIKAIDYKNDKIVANVNGENIYQSEVSEGKANIDFANNHNLSISSLNEKQQQDYLKKYSMTEKDILNELIRNKVVVQKAKTSGTSMISDGELDKKVKSQMDLMKEDKYYCKKVLQAFGMNEEKYSNKLAENFKDQYLRNQYRLNYLNGIGDSDSKDLEKKYEKHVDELVAKADIKFM